MQKCIALALGVGAKREPSAQRKSFGSIGLKSPLESPLDSASWRLAGGIMVDDPLPRAAKGFGVLVFEVEG